jgi:phosphatidylglycerol:prolipoprotein diacylglycerol transferase
MSTGFNIGPLTVHYYGVIIMCGVVLAAFMASYLAKNKGLDPEILWDALTWVLVGGIVGARIWHILTPPPSMVEQGITTMYYLTHPLDAIAIWRGGIGILGAVVGGGLALYIFLSRRQQSFFAWADVIAPGLLLAQAIGRWGNFVNQELYGMPSDLPWAIFIEPARRLPEFADVTHYHPLFLYESLWNLLNMAILLYVGKKFAEKLLVGDIFLGYLVLYPVTRFVLEFLRLDSSTLFSINANQWIMAAVAVASAGLLIYRHRPGAELPTEATPDEPVEPEQEDVVEIETAEPEVSDAEVKE